MRLTNDMRYSIVQGVLAATFDPKVAKIEAKQAVLADKMYLRHYSAKNRKMMEEMPNGFMSERTAMRIIPSEKQRGVGGVADAYNINLEEPRRMASKDANHYGAAVLMNDTKADDAIVQRVHSLSDKLKAIHATRRKEDQRITSILATFGTSQKLLEAWPEMKPYMPPEPEPKAQLPAKIFSEINAELGLPVAEAA